MNATKLAAALRLAAEALEEGAYPAAVLASALPAAPPRRAKRRPTMPRPRKDEAASVTPIIEAQVDRDTQRKGMVRR